MTSGKVCTAAARTLVLLLLRAAYRWSKIMTEVVAGATCVIDPKAATTARRT